MRRDQPGENEDRKEMKPIPSSFPALCRAAGLPEPVAEYRFCPTRRWRLDYAWPELRVALEVEGGIWTRGRHNRGTGFLRDMEKYNALAAAGWRLFRCVPSDMPLAAVAMIREAVANPPPCVNKETHAQQNPARLDG